MPMTYEVATTLINNNGGEENIKSVINDAGAIIILENIGEEKIELDKTLNVLRYPAIDDGDFVIHNISLDSIADIIFNMPNPPVKSPAQSYVCGFDDISPIEYNPEYIKEQEELKKQEQQEKEKQSKDTSPKVE